MMCNDRSEYTGMHHSYSHVTPHMLLSSQTFHQKKPASHQKPDRLPPGNYVEVRKVNS